MRCSFLHAPPPRLSRPDAAARSTSARIRRGRASSSTSSSRSSCRSRRTGRRARRGARRCSPAPARSPASCSRACRSSSRGRRSASGARSATTSSATMPMQRLLQGDVGSGKTIVAALAALQAIESGRQVAFMAPTEILAEQHYRKLAQWLAGPAGRARVALRRPAGEGAQECARGHRRAARRCSRSARTRCSRTRSLLPRLGLAIVDEQHRFGVAQRLKLRGKAMGEAHQLMMSATPIPRTLAMTFYADLDVSVMDEMPPGRTPVVDPARQQQAPRRGDRARAPRVRRGPPGLLGVPADRGVRKAGAADRGRAARGADRRRAAPRVGSPSACCTAG